MRGMRSGKTRRLRDGLKDIQGGLCFYCAKPMRFDGDSGHPDFATLDHLLPTSRGGTNRCSNFVLACFACNSWRGNRPVEVFVEELFG